MLSVRNDWNNLLKKGEVINENEIVLPVPGSHVVAAGIGGKENKIIMKVIKDEVFQVNQNNLGLHYGEGVKKDLQENPNSPCLQNEELSSRDVGPEGIMEIFVQQLHCKGLYDKSVLLGGYPKIEEISDEEFARIKEDALFVSHLDNPGKQGQNGV